MGGGPKHTTSTVYQSQLPEWAEPYYTDLLDRTTVESKRGYTPYEGQRIAGFSPDQQAAHANVRQVASSGLPGLAAASGVAQDALGFQSTPIVTSQYSGRTYDPKAITTRTMDGRDLKGYINPYVRRTLDVQNRIADRRFKEQQLARNQRAVRAGAFGGSRQAVADSMARRDFNEQADAREAEALANAYRSAQSAFTSDEARTLEARQASERNRAIAAEQAQRIFTADADRALRASVANETARRDALSARLRGAAGLAALEKQGQDMRLESSQALSNIGRQKQDLEQRGLEQAYQDFANQRDFGRRQLEFYSNILHGAPVSASQDVHSTSPGPSTLSQLAGAGITGLTLQNLLRPSRT